MKKTNFFLTGEKGIGKSTAILECLQSAQLIEKCQVVGYQTLPYYSDSGMRQGFILHSLIPQLVNDLPISVQEDEQSCKPVLETFETLGVAVLEEAMSGEQSIILLDEIGILESRALQFQQAIYKVLDSKHGVVGVLKQKEHPFIHTIASRKDTWVYTLNQNNRDEIINALKEFLLNNEVIIDA